jgi:cold shock CspA family protein
MKSADVFYGEVEFWNGNSFGFIRPDRGGDDVFFHVSEVQLPDGREPRRGDRVTFDIAGDQHKPGKTRAVSVRLNNETK